MGLDDLTVFGTLEITRKGMWSFPPHIPPPWSVITISSQKKKKKERRFFYSFTDPISLTTFYPNWVAFLWSVQFSHSVVSDSLQHHGLQHARLPHPSPTPRACPNSCPSSQRCHPTISSSVFPFSCLHSFPTSVSFPMGQFFAYFLW